VGQDTVKLKGKHFTPKVKQGDIVTKGQLLMEFDIEAIKAAGYIVTTPVIISNTANFQDVVQTDKQAIHFKEDLITVLI